MAKLVELKQELEKLGNPKQAKVLSRFFKTGQGEYGEGDVFLGIKVPIQRKIAGKYTGLNLKDLESLLKSKIHEHRLTVLIILLLKYKAGNQTEQKKYFDFYIKHTKYINNWDLVDVTSPGIVGAYLLNKSRNILYQLANSRDLWERRISILATFIFIRNNDFKDTLRIARILLTDEPDLIHKAVGWMLREVGKRDQQTEEKFLKKYYQKMPRTMLRYAIERFAEDKRQAYLHGQI